MEYYVPNEGMNKEKFAKSIDLVGKSWGGKKVAVKLKWPAAAAGDGVG